MLDDTLVSVRRECNHSNNNTCIFVSSENRCKNTFVGGYFCIVFALIQLSEVKQNIFLAKELYLYFSFTNYVKM